jgi:hypothetical protein
MRAIVMNEPRLAVDPGFLASFPLISLDGPTGRTVVPSSPRRDRSATGGGRAKAKLRGVVSTNPVSLMSFEKRSNPLNTKAEILF